MKDIIEILGRIALAFFVIIVGIMVIPTLHTVSSILSVLFALSIMMGVVYLFRGIFVD